MKISGDVAASVRGNNGRSGREALTRDSCLRQQQPRTSRIIPTLSAALDEGTSCNAVTDLNGL